MNFQQTQLLLFGLGSGILMIFSLASMIIHRQIDGYSISHDRLSYTGIRKDFTHPIRGTKYSKSSYPEIFNFSVVTTGLLYLVGFLRTDIPVVRPLGIIFALSIVVIGSIDVSTQYHIHNGAVIVSQPIFILFMISLLLEKFDLASLICLIAITILVITNVIQKQRQNRNPDLRVNVIPQKLFIYIEGLFFIYFPLIFL